MTALDVGDELLTNLAELDEKVKQLPDPATAESYRPYLPLFFLFEGKPLTLKNHFPMETMYSCSVPQRITYKCARQVGKSLNLCASTIIRARVREFFKMLFVLPQYEMTRRLSTNYFRPLLEESPIRSMYLDARCENSVLQKTLKNRSIIHFSFAGLTVERCRGLTTDCIGYDEVQDLNPDFIPIIDETMAMSPLALRIFTGTPKTLDNFLEVSWTKSDMAEWVIPCSCGYYNIPALEYDANKMLGPLRNVERYGCGLVCAKCSKTVFPQWGNWVPRIPDRSPKSQGRHIPQLILPAHCQNRRKYGELLDKRDDPQMRKATYFNEVMGESYDQGVKLISHPELVRAACLEWTLDDILDNPVAFNLPHRYKLLVGGVDWGGGGETFESTTCFTVLGVRPDNTVDAVYIERLMRNISDEEEMQRIVYLYKRFGCQYFAHDFAGGGRKADTLVRQARFVSDNLIYPFSYVVTGAKNLVVYHPPNADSFRYYYSYDKTWSISLMLALIRAGRMRFAKYDDKMKDLFADFLNLVEEKRERVSGSDLYLIKRAGSKPDDCVHSTNFAMGAAFHIMDWFPDIAEDFRSNMSKTQRDAIEPDNLSLQDWGERESGIDDL